MGLAEAKVRALFSEDPQNKRWAEDTEKFGYQMLQKMGWQPGKGLGVHEQGQTKHLSLAVKRDNAGLGSVPSNITSATDAYAQILAKLNVNIEPTIDTSSSCSLSVTSLDLSSSIPSTPSSSSLMYRNPSRMKYIKQKKLATTSQVSSFTPNSSPSPSPSPCSSSSSTITTTATSSFIPSTPSIDASIKSIPPSPPSPVVDIFGFVQGGTLIGDIVIPVTSSVDSITSKSNEPNSDTLFTDSKKKKKKSSSKLPPSLDSSGKDSTPLECTSSQTNIHDSNPSFPESIEERKKIEKKSKETSKKRKRETDPTSDVNTDCLKENQKKLKKLKKKKEKAERKEQKRQRKEEKAKKKALKAQLKSVS